MWTALESATATDGRLKQLDFEKLKSRATVQHNHLELLRLGVARTVVDLASGSLEYRPCERVAKTLSRAKIKPVQEVKDGLGWAVNWESCPPKGLPPPEESVGQEMHARTRRKIGRLASSTPQALPECRLLPRLLGPFL